MFIQVGEEGLRLGGSGTVGLVRGEVDDLGELEVGGLVTPILLHTNPRNSRLPLLLLNLSNEHVHVRLKLRVLLLSYLQLSL